MEDVMFKYPWLNKLHFAELKIRKSKHTKLPKMVLTWSIAFST